MTGAQTRTPEPRTRDNELIQALKEVGPVVSDELPRTPNADERQWVGSYDVTRSATGSTKARGRTARVYYLYGDERRTVREFIRENTEFVESCMDDHANPINMSSEDYWWRMFCEEWAWRDWSD